AEEEEKEGAVQPDALKAERRTKTDGRKKATREWRIANSEGLTNVVDTYASHGVEEAPLFPRGGDRGEDTARGRIHRGPGLLQPAHQAGRGRDRSGARVALVEAGRPAVRLGPHAPGQACDQGS